MGPCCCCALIISPIRCMKKLAGLIGSILESLRVWNCIYGALNHKEPVCLRTCKVWWTGRCWCDKSINVKQTSLCGATTDSGKKWQILYAHSQFINAGVLGKMGKLKTFRINSEQILSVSHSEFPYLSFLSSCGCCSDFDLPCLHPTDMALCVSFTQTVWQALPWNLKKRERMREWIGRDIIADWQHYSKCWDIEPRAEGILLGRKCRGTG